MNQLRKITRRKSKRHSGSSILEFLVVFPLILMFFCGVFELGRILAQVGWSMQVTYNAALIAAGNPDLVKTGDSETIGRAIKLFQASLNKEFLAPPTYSVELEDMNSNEQDKFVEVHGSGQLRSLLPAAALNAPFKVATAVPYLVWRTAPLADSFENSASDYGRNGDER